MATRLTFSNLDQIAALGERIYRERYQDRYEREFPEKFVAIDVDTESSYLGDTPEEALENATAANPAGIFYLGHVGFSEAIRLA